MKQRRIIGYRTVYTRLDDETIAACARSGMAITHSQSEVPIYARAKKKKKPAKKLKAVKP